jgi:hypothetical protein
VDRFSDEGSHVNEKPVGYDFISITDTLDARYSGLFHLSGIFRRFTGIFRRFIGKTRKNKGQACDSAIRSTYFLPIDRLVKPAVNLNPSWPCLQNSTSAAEKRRIVCMAHLIL